MKIKDILKNQTTVVAIAIVLVALTLTGVSYAIFFDVKANTKNQVITAGTLKLIISATEEELTNIDGDSLVMINDVGISSSPIATYTVNHTEESTLPASYTIYLDIQNENILDYVKLSIDEEEYFGITDLSENDILTVDNNTYYKIDSNTLQPGVTGTTTELRLWLDEDMITQDIKEETVTINLYIISEVAEENIE
ncbi:MAG: hypothetical protein E7163_03760 [Firmicutes bacterium]|nr:hypothetical protein [Bacillota bacterium]